MGGPCMRAIARDCRDKRMSHPPTRYVSCPSPQVEQRSQGVTMTVRATTTQAPGGASAPRPAADTASSSHMGSADRPPSFSTSFPLTPSPFTPSNPVFRLRSATAQGSAAGAADEAPGPSGVVGSPTGAAGPSAARTGPRHPYRPDVGSQATPPTLAIGQLIEFFSRLSSLGDSAPNTRGMVGYRTQRPGLSDFNQAGLGGQPRSLNPAVLDDFGGLFGEGGRLMSAAEEMRRLTELLMGGSRGTPARFIDSLPKWTHRAREKRASEEEDEQVRGAEEWACEGVTGGRRGRHANRRMRALGVRVTAEAPREPSCPTLCLPGLRGVSGGVRGRRGGPDAPLHAQVPRRVRRSLAGAEPRVPCVQARRHGVIPNPGRCIRRRRQRLRRRV